MKEKAANRILILLFLTFIALATVARFGPAIEGDDPNTDGVWRSQGYGLLLELRLGKAKLYQVTRVSCIPVSDERSSRYDLENFDDVRLNSTGDLLTLHRINGNIYRYTLEVGLPAACSSYTPTKDPEHNFEVFWNTFEENYLFFHINQVDWQAMYKVYRPRVTKDTTDDELFEIFGQMVAPLKDAHVSIRAGDKRLGHSGYKLEDKEDDVWNLVRSKYLQGKYNTRLNQLSYGTLDDKTGYLRIRAMSGFTRYPSRPSEETLQLLGRAMDEIIESFQGLSKVVVDVRFNGGGSDEYSRCIAERFTDRRRLAYSKQARQGSYSEFTPKVDFYLEPKGPRQFTDEVVVLANGASVSATEIFMLCMQALPHVTIVGKNTEGSFSDILGRSLPNGWRVGLSNEAYINHKGVCLEGPGVAPHIEVPLTIEDLENGRDLALEKAMSL